LPKSPKEGETQEKKVSKEIKEMKEKLDSFISELRSREAESKRRQIKEDNA